MGRGEKIVSEEEASAMKEWDLIVDRKPGKGSWNMAVDEFLFESVQKTAAKTVLRFYSWRRPTVSIGYSQEIAEAVDVAFCRENGIDIVRRLTGGKLVLHHQEVTYSLSSSDNALFPSTVAGSYRRISEALMIGLERMGLVPALADATPEDYRHGRFPCFSHPARDEVTVDGRKIVGSAQKRIGSCFLQHGSIPLEVNEKLLASVSSDKESCEGLRMTSLSRAIGENVKFDGAVKMFIDGISEYFTIQWNERYLTAAERQVIRKVQRERYSHPDWTFRGSSEASPLPQ